MILNIAPFCTKSERQDVLKTIPDSFSNPEVEGYLVYQLNEKVVSLVIEYPYVDKDYRSTYYGFYSKRHKTYDQFCIRLHFFNKIIKEKESLQKSADGYLGSVVLRPTEVATLGRTLLVPEVIKGFSGYICEAEKIRNN